MTRTPRYSRTRVEKDSTYNRNPWMIRLTRSDNGQDEFSWHSTKKGAEEWSEFYLSLYRS